MAPMNVCDAGSHVSVLEATRVTESCYFSRPLTKSKHVVPLRDGDGVIDWSQEDWLQGLGGAD